MRTLHLTRLFDGSGGCPLYLQELLPELERAGHPTALVCAHRGPATDEVSVPVEVIPELFDYSLRPPRPALERLRRVADRFQPHLIHLHDLDSPHTVDLCSSLRPLVRTFHDYRPICPGTIRYYRTQERPCQVTFGPYCLYSAYANWCNSRSPTHVARSYLRVRGERARRGRYRRIIVASEHVAGLVRDEGYPAERIEVLPYFVPTPVDGGGGQPPPGGPPRILFVGRVAEIKGLDRLLRALARVEAPWELDVAGDGYSLAACRALAATLGLTERVRFLGWVDGPGKWRLLRESYLVAVPSLWPEPFGIVGLEAMAAGKPVVAFASGGIPEWLRDGETGTLSASGDEADLSRGIQALLADPDRARTLGEEGRRSVQARFGRAQHVERLLGIYAGSVEAGG